MNSGNTVALEEAVGVLLTSSFTFLGQEVIHIPFAHNLIWRCSRGPTNFRGAEKYGEADGIFGEHHCHSMIYSQQNHAMIPRKDCHDIKPNFVSNVSTIIGVFKLRGKIETNFQMF